MGARKEKAAKKDQRKGDRHKPGGVKVRVWPQYRSILEQLGDTVTSWTNQAVQEMLERKGLWPPPSAQK